MRIAFLGIGLLLFACGNETPDANPDDASTTADGNKADSSSDATVDTGNDASSDGSSNDGSDESTTDSGIDTGTLDAGDPDGSICPPCPMNFACCTIMKSMNYGKCTAKACLACCM